MPDRTTDEETLKTHYPAVRANPDNDTFEIALVLAGAVSAGAYTAGVMDFLTEALDTWYRLKSDPRTAASVPQHNVVLKVIAGASAGGMNGAIAAAAYEYRFPHVSGRATALKPHPGTATGNPFYDSWVVDIDIKPLLDPVDLIDRNAPPPALLNCARLDVIRDKLINFKSAPVPLGMRDWLANPFEVRLTCTNLRGVPFAFDLQAGASASTPRQAFLMHGDHVAFSVATREKTEHRPDCMPLLFGSTRGSDQWRLLGTAALATGAFPIALAARGLSVDPKTYDWRHSFFDNSGTGTHEPVFVRPSWPDGQPPLTYEFTAVDGGVMDNEPFKVAHDVLSGPRGQNAQLGETACRAVIVIDPFAEAPTPGDAHLDSLAAVAGGIFRAQINQSRIAAQDFVQIAREDVYSRFMIAPKRSDKSGTLAAGAAALASSRLQAFGGFLSEDYRRHDYLLGRRNAQWFLKSVFTLPENNPIVKDKPVKVGDATNGKPDVRDHFQIIPVLCDCHEEEPLPDWPAAMPQEQAGEIVDLAQKRTQLLSELFRESIASSAAKAGANTPEGRLKSKFGAGAVRSWLAIGWAFARSGIFKKIETVTRQGTKN